jgi:hypothetical protein
MPKGFDDCVKAGGKVRTVAGPNKQMGLKEGEYRHLCIKNGRVHSGETKTKK